MARKHKLDEVLRTLIQKNDIRISKNETIIRILYDKVWDRKKGEYIDNPRKKHDLGNGSWGKIDFLVNYHGYSIIQVNEF